MSSIGGHTRTFKTHIVNVQVSTVYGEELQLEIQTKPIITNGFPGVNLSSIDVAFLKAKCICLANSMLRPINEVKTPTGLHIAKIVFGPTIYGKGVQQEEKKDGICYGMTSIQESSEQEILQKLFELEGLGISSEETQLDEIDGTELVRVSTFKYLGSTIACNGDLSGEVNVRVSSAWTKWHASTGVLCDRKIPERLKSKIYRTVIRPVALYGAECWPATREVERRLSVMEMKMLRWMAGVTRLDRKTNAEIRERFGVAPIPDKLREYRLRWYGHVLRASDDTVCKIGLGLNIQGTSPSDVRSSAGWIRYT
ncbi:unnamed protein product [Nippostrongylus brasiliensis]|uniref:Reverse transcriptase n=1 Tax=Nippostrongylus brasiliensis TaxID=27835 RepID=A0A0N4Y9P3_NIPBR|nr:unnamed protein product [Nippostrongylus brasiliensis]